MQGVRACPGVQQMLPVYCCQVRIWGRPKEGIRIWLVDLLLGRSAVVCTLPNPHHDKSQGTDAVDPTATLRVEVLAAE